MTASAQTGPEASLPVTAALFHAGGVLIAAGGTARLYSSSGSLSATLGGHPPSATIAALSTNADDTLIASAAGTSLIIHNRATNTQNALHAKPSKVTYSALAFAPHRRTFLAAGTSTGLLHLFDTTKPSAPLRTIALCSSPLPPPVTNIAFSATSSALLIACTSTGQLSLIDTEKLKVVVSMEIGIAVEKGQMSLGPDGRTALFAGKGVVLVLDIKSRKGIKEVPIENGGRLGGISFAVRLPRIGIAEIRLTPDAAPARTEQEARPRRFAHLIRPPRFLRPHRIHQPYARRPEQ